ncbi:hypothetical protein BDU57DRAFT_514862 [Ampelomyces quisqualis]|uniref:Uncharacterized protein n=1 Tax=Ampelomyces quisqualis TaxID=50730 RepID=A0A6A5QR30_AMPQU|nr:hypothetical protein BDU57DRAFT_514862 [Ampelomyces quisqualis]
MSDDAETPARPRTSRFKEHTNTTSSIKPPPDELWKDLGIEDMLDKFNEENNAPPTRKGVSKAITPPVFGAPAISGPATAAPVTPAVNEGTFGRFSRAFASVFGGLGSVLGKRKAGNADAEREKEREQRVLDERKLTAEQAYEARKLAQEMGLMPTPKVFVRPTAAPRTHNCAAEHIAPPATPRTPSLYKSPSKKDLQKQMKLSARVSDLENKLASARKELHGVLRKEVPPVPPLPFILPPTASPETSQDVQMFSQTEVVQDTEMTEPETAPHEPTPSHKPVGKIVKKRKATTIDDETYKPIPTESDGDLSMSATSEPERSVKRVKSQSSRKGKRQTSRLNKSRSKSDLRREDAPVTVVPDGKKVPAVPAIPNGVEGKKSQVRDDGFGGFGHEIF